MIDQLLASERALDLNLNLNRKSKPNLNQALEEAGETIDQLLASERALKQALVLKFCKSARYCLLAQRFSQ